jgi:hypothetical protein
MKLACVKVVAVWLAALTASNADQVADAAAVKRESLRQSESRVKLPLNIAFRSMNVCAGSPIPKGWIKTDDSWNPTVCGQPTSIVPNVITITRYVDMPVGSILSVCADAPRPRGWAEIDRSWNPTRCGRPTSIVNNVKLIKKIA